MLSAIVTNFKSGIITLARGSAWFVLASYTLPDNELRCAKHSCALQEIISMVYEINFIIKILNEDQPPATAVWLYMFFVMEFLPHDCSLPHRIMQQAMAAHAESEISLWLKKGKPRNFFLMQ